MRIGILSNARSGRNRRRIRELDRVLAGRPEVLHLTIEEGGDSVELLREMAAREIELLVISGGDGTVSRVLTALLEARIWDHPPPVAILPRGTANMTAADVGLRNPGPRGLEALLKAVAEGVLDRHLLVRPVLKVRWAADRPAVRGMFFGAAGIVDAIRICTGSIHSRGLYGEVSHLLTLLWLLATITFRGLEAAGIGCERMRVVRDGEREREGPRLLLLATTLDRLVMRSRPFWNVDGRPIRFTSVLCPPPRLLRCAPRVLYGGPERALPAEYESCGARRLDIHPVSRFTVDGEMYRPAPDFPVTVTADERLRFVRL